MSFIGESLLRTEDGPLLRGQGRFVADFRVPGMLHAVVVRSPHAHAWLRSVDGSAALRRPGIAAVLTGADLPSDLGPIPLRLTYYAELGKSLQPPLATDRVRYVGEPVAVVVAASRYAAEDAAQEVRVAYEPLPVVASVSAALTRDAVVLHEALGHNVGCRFEQRVGDVERALAEADLLIEETFTTNRLTATPLECRGLAAAYDPGREQLTVWGGAKVVHFNRAVLSKLLGLDESHIHYIDTDAGGGFGARGEFYPEDYLIPYLALSLGRSVGWVEDRREHLLAINHSRQQRYTVRLGMRRDGTILGLHALIDNDHGAYSRTHGATTPEIGSALLPGPYRVPNFLAEVRCVLTNKTPTGTYRGPGRCEGTFVRERLMDMAAARLDLDPAEIRRRNFIASTQMPYEVGTYGLGEQIVYDCGDYAGLLDRALSAIDYVAASAEQSARPTHGRRLGIGISAFVEKSGTGPWEYGRVEVDASGHTTLFSGTASVGQGVGTILAQIVADGLGIRPDQVDVVCGDTDRVPYGVGAFASRGTVVGGAAALEAARKVRHKALAAAARLLEVEADDIELADGFAGVKGVPAHRLTLGEIARACLPGQAAPGMELGLSAEHVAYATRMTYPGGVHASVVEVDPETGEVTVERYAVAYDIGRAINPLLVAGQIQGGLAQGLGGALLEDLVYDAEGQLLTGTLMDYLLPTSLDVPNAAIAIDESTPTMVNPLGAKGAGEAGCTGVAGCLANAVANALGAKVCRLPLSPEEVLRLARGSGR